MGVVGAVCVMVGVLLGTLALRWNARRVVEGRATA
jgi:hypothetical protein